MATTYTYILYCLQSNNNYTYIYIDLQRYMTKLQINAMIFELSLQD